MTKSDRKGNKKVNKIEKKPFCLLSVYCLSSLSDRHNAVLSDRKSSVKKSDLKKSDKDSDLVFYDRLRKLIDAIFLVFCTAVLFSLVEICISVRYDFKNRNMVPRSQLAQSK